MAKTKIYTNVVSLEIIALRLGNHLQEHKQEVVYCADQKHKTWCFIQTRRFAYIKPINKKCINITLQGTIDECKITIDGGKWGENIFEGSNQATLIPYKGIFAPDKRSVAPIITERQIWSYLEENI